MYMKKEPIETLPLYYDVAYKGLWVWPKIYSLCIEEIKRCIREHSCLTMYKENPNFNGLYKIPILHSIEPLLEGTNTCLKRDADRLILDIHKLDFKNNKHIPKTITRLGWTQENITTLIKKNIPEFQKLKEQYCSFISSSKEFFEQIPLCPEGLQCGFEDNTLATSNKKRVQAVFSIIEAIELIYTNCYTEFVNDVLTKIQQGKNLED